MARLPNPIWNLITDFLDNSSYARFSQVCEWSRQQCRNPSSWKQRVLHNFTTDLEFFEFSLCQSVSFAHLDWHLVFGTVFKARQEWLGIDNLILTPKGADCVFEEVWESLRNPSPPLPTLHRETEVDPKTILQEIIAYPDEPRFVVGMEICEIFVSELIGQAQVLYEEVQGTDMALLFKAKWGLKEYNDFSPQRSSLGSSDLSQYSTTDNDFSGFSEKKSLQLGQSMMLKVYRALKYTFKAYCEIVNNVLSEISDDLSYLSEYNKYWNAYTASIFNIDYAFSQYAGLFNEMYQCMTSDVLQGPKFSVMRLMVSQWRRTVFVNHETKLLQCVIKLLQQERQENLQRMQNYYQRDQTILLANSINAVMDLSLHEVNIKACWNDNFVPSGGYYTIHNTILQETQQFYESLTANEIGGIINHDLIFLKQLVLPATALAVEKLVADQFMKKVQQQCQQVLQDNYNLIYSGKYLTVLNNLACSLVVKQAGINMPAQLLVGFIQQNQKDLYDSLSLHDKIYNEVQYLGQVGQEICPEEDALFTLYRDLTPATLESIRNLNTCFWTPKSV